VSHGRYARATPVKPEQGYTFAGWTPKSSRQRKRPHTPQQWDEILRQPIKSPLTLIAAKGARFRP
jgi:hypothetical protein